MFAGIHTPRVFISPRNKAVQYSSTSGIKRVLWIVGVEDPENQRRRDAEGIAPRVNANLEDKAAVHLLAPTIAGPTFKS